VARNRYMVSLVFLAFFVMSFLTNILGPIVPDIISSFHVSLIAAAFLAFAFFIAFGVMSFPAGFLVERFTEKPVMILAFLVGTLGSLSFALFPQCRVAAVSLFVMGAGMATPQVAINPLLHILAGVTPADLPWASIYWIFAAFALLMTVVLWLARLPTVLYTAEERPGSREMHRSLAGKSAVWIYFLAMCAYVGCEQGTADGISKFLSKYHGFNPHPIGAAAVSWFGRWLTAGCSVGMLLLKIFDSHRVLIGACVSAWLCLSAASFGPARVSVVSFPAIGHFASGMWPIVGSLGWNSVAGYYGAFTGILNTGIMGGAAVPTMIGRIGDLRGLQSGLPFLYLTFGFVLSVGFWANPLISNATISLKKATEEVSV